MIYPNLQWALQHRRMTLYDLVPVLHVSDGQICRKFNGKAALAPHEKQRVAEVLGFDHEWLFAEPRPVRLKIGSNFTPAYETRAAAAQ